MTALIHASVDRSTSSSPTSGPATCRAGKRSVCVLLVVRILLFRSAVGQHLSVGAITLAASSAAGGFAVGWLSSSHAAQRISLKSRGFLQGNTKPPTVRGCCCSATDAMATAQTNAFNSRTDHSKRQSRERSPRVALSHACDIARIGSTPCTVMGRVHNGRTS